MSPDVSELIDLLFEREGVVQALVFTHDQYAAIQFSALLSTPAVYWNDVGAWSDAHVPNAPYDDP